MTALVELEGALRPNANPDEAIETLVSLEGRLQGDRVAAVKRLEGALAQPGLSRWVRIAVLDALAHLDDPHKWKPLIEAEVKDEGETDGTARALALIALRRIEYHKDPLEVDALWSDALPEQEIVAGLARSRRTDKLSLVIHGTWASDGDWWRPGGDFFEYLHTKVNVADLYRGEAPFKWSGRNQDDDRREAARALFEWVRDNGPTDSLSVYAHSHGSNVTMLATHYGLKVDRLVMMSTPVRPDYFAQWPNVKSAYSMQASRDAVVALARGGRTFNLPQIVQEKVVKENGHSSTHTEKVWVDEKIPAWVKLV